jgi:hypothetical protein
MNTRNSKATCWIDTHRVTLCAMEEDTSYPLQPPSRTARDVESHNARAKALRWILAVDALAFAAMGLLIYLF